MNAKWKLAIFATIVSLTAAAPVALAQQPRHPNSGPGSMMPGRMMGPGVMGRGMMGPGMMGPGMMGSGMMGGRGMMMGGCSMMGSAGETFAKGRVAFLKAELGITDEQKAAFDAYATALSDNLENMHSMWQSMMEMMSAKTPVERLDIHLTVMESRVTALKAIKPKLAALYTTLSDEQKKKADHLLTGMGCMM